MASWAPSLNIAITNVAPRLSEQTSKFDVAFFVCKSLLETEGQKKLVKFAILS